MRSFSTRFRVAVAAALTTGIALTAGSFWFVHTLENNVIQQADSAAFQHAVDLSSLISVSGDPKKLSVGNSAQFGMFEVVDGAGNRVLSCPDRGPAAADVPYLAPRKGTVNSPFDVPSRTLTVFVGMSLVEGPAVNTDPCAGWEGQSWLVRVVSTPVPGSQYWVYAAVPFSESGQDVVDSVARELLIGVPLLVLLVAVVAWFAVRGSLRPVAAISAEVAEISATDLRRRVPVPTTGDEITRLATTMNAMLGRVSESVDQQRQFIADASHELRTPLTSMRTQLEVLFAHDDRIDWRQATQNVALDVGRLQDLVADLLLLARLEGRPVASEPLGLAGLVDLADVVAECLPGRPRRSEVTLTSEWSPVTVVGSDTQLGRVVGNLLDNAERHARSAVHVSVGRDGALGVLSVADDGPGIPVADRDRVFDRFVRLDEARSGDAGGSGLGLAIVRDIVHAHGGTVTVTDNVAVADDCPGARFVVRLPLAEFPSG